MSVAISSWSDWDAPEPRSQALWVPCGHLDRAEAAAAEGDIAAAEHFFGLAGGQIREAVALAMFVNQTQPGDDGAVRLRAIANRLADGNTEPTRGCAIVFRYPEGDAYVSVWLTLGRVGPDTGALLHIARASPA